MKRVFQVDPVHSSRPSRFPGSMASSELEKWDSAPDHSTGETYDDVDSAKLGENPCVYRNIPPAAPHRHLTNPESQHDTPENQAGNAYYSTTPPYRTPSGGWLRDDYQDTRATEARASLPDGLADVPSYPSTPPQGSVIPTDLLRDGDVPDASTTFNGLGLDYSDHRYPAYLPPIQGAGIAGYGHLEAEPPIPSPGALENTLTDFYLGDQHSSADPSHNRDFYGREAQNLPDTGGAYQLSPATWESRPPLDITPETLMASNEVDAWGHVDPSTSHPTRRVVNEGATEPPTASPPAEIANVVSQNPKKRKRVTIPAETRKAKRNRHRRSQRPDPRGLTQDVIPPAILFTRPHLHKVEQDPYESENLQKDWTPLPPIEFKVNGVEGMSLTDAMNRHFDGLDGRDDPMFTDESIRNSVSCRIDLVRYPVDTKPRQIVTTNHKKERRPIAKEKLARDVAKCVKAHLGRLNELKTPFPVPLEDMYLTKLTNVSRASWQPEIWHQAAPSTNP